MSWKVEVVADSTGRFIANGLRYGAKDQAERAARDLEMRWMAVQKWRVIECDDPVTEKAT